MRPVERGVPPAPTGAQCVDDVVRRLRELRAWAGVSEREMHRRVRRARSGRGVAELPAFDTVHRCFSPGRKRLNEDLVVEIAAVLGGDALRWRQALQGLAGGRLPESPRLGGRVEPRLLHHYWHTAVSAMARYAPYECHQRPVAHSPAPVFRSRADATAWLNAERPTLVAVAGAHSAEFSELLGQYLEGGCHYRDAETLHTAAARSSCPRTRANALRRLSVVRWKTGRYPAALACLREALTLFRACGDRAGEGKALNNLGSVYRRMGRPREALRCYPRSIAFAGQAADRDAEANARNCLGILHAWLGRHRAAEEQQRIALDLFRDIGNQSGACRVWCDLGDVLMRTGRYDAALRCFPPAMAAAADVGDQVGLGLALARDWLVHARLGTGASSDRLDQARRIAAETGDCALESEIRYGPRVVRW
ncbi:TPR repeat [Actinokineospora spheciospongiae]|uniref:TPR repeat n=1 Tax=Actinokineospora spheciospongiae TaxID=909613 RepID=W7IJ09_9PSEU|nr:tetratricopeptide repeat protein [Actinokineospora spheciospongiae]EWC60765.1 TPR repeat [Actinokineospora spheciospongiae]